MSAIAEAAKWGARVFRLLPELVGLWEAIEGRDEPQTLDAILALRRKVSDEQMRESLERG